MRISGESRNTIAALLLVASLISTFAVSSPFAIIFATTNVLLLFKGFGNPKEFLFITNKVDKEVCKICRKETRESLTDKDCIDYWSDVDDVFWKQGKVKCPPNGMIHEIDKTPPVWCKYALEQMMRKT